MSTGPLPHRVSTRFPVDPDHARALRQALGLSPRELARRLTIGKSSVYRYEAVGAPAWLPRAIHGLATGHARPAPGGGQRAGDLADGGAGRS